ncbi:MAG: alpha/beta hydrolase [Hyphomonadaceae bacterium]
MPKFWIIVVTLLALAGCATREIPYSDLRARYGLPSSHTFEPEPGLRVHYTDEGNVNGRTLILVHGLAASVQAWRPWVQRLSTDFRLVAIDLPGHGLTEAPPGYRASLDRNAALVEALADEIGAKRFVLTGNSMGGAVSLAYAMAHPERLDGLVLVDAAGWPGADGKRGGPPGFVGLFDNPVGHWFMKLVDPRLVITGGLKSAYHDETLVTKDVEDRYANFAMAVGHRDILLTQQPQPSRPWTPLDFNRITTPTLVMAGEKDALIPVDDARAIAAAIPGAKLVTYPDGGHLPMEQLPEETVRDLRVFLGSLPQAR